MALKDRYSEITEGELSAIISAIKASFPNAGSQVCKSIFVIQLMCTVCTWSEIYATIFKII